MLPTGFSSIFVFQTLPPSFLRFTLPTQLSIFKSSCLILYQLSSFTPLSVPSLSILALYCTNCHHSLHFQSPVYPFLPSSLLFLNYLLLTIVTKPIFEPTDAPFWIRSLTFQPHPELDHLNSHVHKLLISHLVIYCHLSHSIQPRLLM